MEAATARLGSEPRASRSRGRVLDWRLNVYAGLALLYLLLPIAIIILFSFNDTKSRFNFVWQGFTLEHWEDPFAIPGLARRDGEPASRSRRSRR